jgi:glycosyltransferase involved in cell wall biosynthesis
MHIALIADEERLESEHAMLNRLSIGLIDEGAQLTRFVPDRMADEGAEGDELFVALAQRVTVPVRIMPWMRRSRAQRLAEQVQRAVPDLLYAVGSASWRIAMDLADVLRRPVVLDVWSMAQARRAGTARIAQRLAGLFAPTEPLAESLRQRVDPAMVAVVPYGVPIPAQTRAILPDDAEAVSVAVLGSGRDVPAYRAALEGLAAAVRELPQLMAFLELRGGNDHEVWRIVRKLNLLPHVSAITSAAKHRPLLTRCDLLMLPERLGEFRSLTLEAMAAGMPVIASADPVREMLRHEETAIIARGGAAEWAGALSLVGRDRAKLRAIGQAGRTLVSEHYRSSNQSRRLLEAFERARGTGPLAFAAQGAVPAP